MKLDMRKKQEKKETTKSTKKLPMTAKMKRAIHNRLEFEND